MINNLTLQGRLTKDVELKVTTTGTTIATINIAQNDAYKKDVSHFFKCKAFGKTAEFLGNYFSKGSEILIEARLINANYEKDGKKVFQDDILIDKVHFCGSAKKQEEPVQQGTGASDSSSDSSTPF